MKHCCRRCRRPFFNMGRSIGFNKILCMECGEFLSCKYDKDNLPKSYKGFLDEKWDWDEE